MVNQISWDVGEDVAGYGHLLMNNVAYKGRNGLWSAIDVGKCTLVNNSFLPSEYCVTEDDFENTSDYLQLTAPRKDDGSLPDINFLKIKNSSPLYGKRIGRQFKN